MTIALTLQKYLAASVATQLWHKETSPGCGAPAHRSALVSSGPTLGSSAMVSGKS